VNVQRLMTGPRLSARVLTWADRAVEKRNWARKEVGGPFRSVLLYSFLFLFFFFLYFQIQFEFKLCGSPLQIISVKLEVLILGVFIYILFIFL
jgi:hypothetical protein